MKGHTAFRTPEDAARFSANQKAKREAAKASAASLAEETMATPPVVEEDGAAPQDKS